MIPVFFGQGKREEKKKRVQHVFIIVPCKYKTGHVLGNGTYATVKGIVYAPYLPFFLTYLLLDFFVQRQCM